MAAILCRVSSARGGIWIMCLHKSISLWRWLYIAMNHYPSSTKTHKNQNAHCVCSEEAEFKRALRLCLIQAHGVDGRVDCMLQHWFLYFLPQVAKVGVRPISRQNHAYDRLLSICLLETFGSAAWFSHAWPPTSSWGGDNTGVTAMVAKMSYHYAKTYFCSFKPY